MLMFMLCISSDCPYYQKQIWTGNTSKSQWQNTEGQFLIYLCKGSLLAKAGQILLWSNNESFQMLGSLMFTWMNLVYIRSSLQPTQIIRSRCNKPVLAYFTDVRIHSAEPGNHTPSVFPTGNDILKSFLQHFFLKHIKMNSECCKIWSNVKCITMYNIHNIHAIWFVRHVFHWKHKSFGSSVILLLPGAL